MIDIQLELSDGVDARKASDVKTASSRCRSLQYPSRNAEQQVLEAPTKTQHGRRIIEETHRHFWHANHILDTDLLTRVYVTRARIRG
jgi:hypothetical protein